MKELVEYIAKTLSEKPDDVQVAIGADHVLELRLAPGDVGRVIGRRGKTAKAIRTLLAASGDWDLDISGHGEEAGGNDRDDDRDDEDDDEDDQE